MKVREWVISACFVATLVAPPARAASPELSTVIPRGGQRGTEIDVVFNGDRFGDAQEIFLYSPGITVSKLDAADPKKLKAKFTIAPDAPIGEHCLRVRTATGISPLRTFHVGALSIVPEVEPNTDFDKPQKIDLNVTMAGVIENEDVDYYAIDLKKGQRLTAEVEGMRLATNAVTIFDPFVAILDGKRFELTASDDSALFLQDPVASLVAPEDGTYVIQVRESAYGGDGNCHYRLHVGTFPRPRAVFPAGGQVGTDQAVQFIGDPSGTFEQTFKLPAELAPSFPLFAAKDGVVSPSANRFRVVPFGNVMEVEPNNEIKTATPVASLPIAMNGVIGTKGDVDFFKIVAKKDQTLDFNVYGRRVRSPIDSVIHIFDAAGKVLGNGNDDNGGPDSYQRFAFPADGEYTVRVYDQLYDGGPEYVYRIEATPVIPAPTLGIPLVTANSQERQTIAVPRGNRYATLIRATRNDFGGPMTLSFKDLPKGVTVLSNDLTGDLVPVLFEAAADAPTAGNLCDVTGTPTDANSPVRAPFAQTVDMVYRGNDPAYYQTTVSKLAVAVTEEAPFKLSVVQPKVPIVQGGSMQLKVVAERKAGFVAPISVAMLLNPNGVGSGGATIAENATETVIPLSASGDAGAAKSRICVIGSADVGGAVWVASPFAELEVAAPFVTAKIEMTAAEQGKGAQVLCNLDQKTPFEGKAKIQLVGLPPNATAADAEITSAEKSIAFDVKAGEKTPVGQHNSLFCQVTIVKDGEPIVHNLGQGGVLRVDAPPPAPASNAVVAAAPTTVPAKPEKPLSRLEKLRLEAQQSMK